MSCNHTTHMTIIRMYQGALFLQSRLPHLWTAVNMSLSAHIGWSKSSHGLWNYQCQILQPASDFTSSWALLVDSVDWFQGSMLNANHPKHLQHLIYRHMIRWLNTWPPVTTARSCKFAFLFSPKPGALMAHTWQQSS
jgi:hypothetical protein